jgi:hypothetical protein
MVPHYPSGCVRALSGRHLVSDPSVLYRVAQSGKIFDDMIRQS